MEASMSAKGEESHDTTEQPHSSCQLTSVPPMTPRRTSKMLPSAPTQVLSPNQKIITPTKMEMGGMCLSKWPGHEKQISKAFVLQSDGMLDIPGYQITLLKDTHDFGNEVDGHND